jgi:hypothetical protein
VRVRTIYTLAGGSWGLVLGVIAAVTAVTYALGFSWLFLFGDDPWPASIGWAYLAGGMAVFLGVLVMFVWAGHRRGRRLEASGAGAAEIRRGAWLIAGSFAMALGTLGALALKARVDDRAAAVRAEQDAAFSELLSRRHLITDWLSEGREASVDVHLILSGSRMGRYRLSWVLSDGLYGEELFRDSTEMELQPGEREITLVLETPLVAQRYREQVLAGRGGVLVENELPLFVALEPLLSPAELASLPGRERHNLEIGASTLRVEVERSAGAEIQPADPAARRLALTIVVVIGALGLVPIIWLRNTLDTISELRHTDPLEATRMMLAVSRLLGAATAVVCFATAIWLGWLGLRMKRAERFPLPNARVVRDTPVLTGAAARRQARIALVFALALSGVLVPVLLMRLTSLLAPGTG